MKFCAIICELNPLTNGHAYLFNKAKEALGLPLIALMSGNFVQRGEPAIIDKHARARLAIEAGCDFCLELPTAFAVSPAPNFAYGAVKALTTLNCVSHLAFGSECGNIEVLNNIANFLNNPSRKFKTILKHQLALGKNFNTAQSFALKEALPNLPIEEILKGPNNILGIEYIRAILTLGAKITPVTFTRTDNGLNSAEPAKNYLGASAVRKLTAQKKWTELSNYVCPQALNALKNAHFDYRAFDKFLLHTLRTTAPLKLGKLFDCAEGLNFALSNSATTATTIKQTIKSVSGKRYRQSRIARLVLYSALNLSKTTYKNILKEPCALKLLSARASQKNNLSILTAGTARIIVTSRDYQKHACPSLTLDLNASNLYATFNALPFNADLTRGTLFV